MEGASITTNFFMKYFLCSKQQSTAAILVLLILTHLSYKLIALHTGIQPSEPPEFLYIYTLIIGGHIEFNDIFKTLKILKISNAKDSLT